ncbi:MAG: dephospho-CoA kinase [Ruminococcus sp.]|nr:dephospho-CoA kinase [Ruminococcus sp.]MCD7801014.1 dephospho-CoA kinase [Ruminococcus sp.]
MEKRIINTEKSLIVGLTGQTGAGKTTVSEMFLENGFYIINADLIARMVMDKDTPCLNDVVSAFGNDILNENGELNRRRLSDIIFNDKNQLERLNSITYPYIVEKIQVMINSALTFCSNKILIDAPTLFESGCNKLCDIIVSVVSNRDLRLRRIISRDNITKSQAESRIKSQLSEDFFRTHSDYIIENNTSIQDLQLKSLDVISKIVL